MWVAQLLIAAALVSQAGTGPAPATTVTRHREFAIPFQLKQADTPASQPAEVQLYVSTDRGAHWRFYAKAPASQKHFMFRAGGDGEYWFAIRTIDRSGQVLPRTISSPGLRVIVNSTGSAKTPPPSAKQPQTTARKPSISNKHERQIPAGSVAIAINPAIGENRDAPEQPAARGPRMVNSRLFELEYEIDEVGPSGIGRVELWGTRDGGRTWRSFALDNDNRSPLLASVAEEGVYGFRITVSNGLGLGGKPPQPGDQPEVLIGVDLTKPVARIVSAEQGIDDETGNLIISWQADDRKLAERPVSIYYGTGRAGPWLPVAEGLKNTGRHAWPLDEHAPARFYLRLVVRDEAGNVAEHETAEPVEIDRSRPTVRIRSVRPVSRGTER